MRIQKRTCCFFLFPVGEVILFGDWSLDSPSEITNYVHRVFVPNTSTGISGICVADDCHVSIPFRLLAQQWLVLILFYDCERTGEVWLLLNIDSKFWEPEAFPLKLSFSNKKAWVFGIPILKETTNSHEHIWKSWGSRRWGANLPKKITLNRGYCTYGEVDHRYELLVRIVLGYIINHFGSSKRNAK
jgi:hypothetical protein